MRVMDCSKVQPDNDYKHWNQTSDRMRSLHRECPLIFLVSVLIFDFQENIKFLDKFWWNRQKMLIFKLENGGIRCTELALKLNVFFKTFKRLRKINIYLIDNIGGTLGIWINSKTHLP